MFSKYHLIKYFLDKDYHNNIDNLNSWMNDIYKIFNKDIPLALLYGLIKKDNDELTELCYKYIDLIMLRVQNQVFENELRHKKYKRWLAKLEQDKARRIKDKLDQKTKELDDQIHSAFMSHKFIQKTNINA